MSRRKGRAHQPVFLLQRGEEVGFRSKSLLPAASEWYPILSYDQLIDRTHDVRQGGSAMLTLNASKDVEFCDGLSRRDFIKAGSLGMLGLTMADLLAARQASAAAKNDVNCIILFLVGAPSHLDTWDLKPNAPAEVRGPFKPICTNVPGIDICEHFPLMARMADKYALIRSVYHNEAPIHETGHQLMQTGWLFRGGTEYPHYGSVLAKLRGRKSELPPYVVIPRPIGSTGVSVPHGQEAGYLGKRYDPFVLNADPAAPDFNVKDLTPSESVDPARLKSRYELLEVVDEAHRRYDRRPDLFTDDDTYHERAFGSVLSPQAKAAFDIAADDEKLRNRYGRNTFGQSCVLARRLVERGVRLVTVNMFDTVFNEITWDCHANGGSLAVTLDDYKETLCPMFDRAYTALLSDLSQRGMLDRTLVIAMGEFGRTYKLNNRGGRDHWPGVWTTLFAGAGTQGGQVVGASDKIGGYPVVDPYGPEDFAATIYHALGIPKTAIWRDELGRPHNIYHGEPISALF